MSTIKRMNDVIDYIEANITNEIDYKIIAHKACYPENQFQRVFSYITEITLSEYIRLRRLTLSAFELQQDDNKVIDVANKYGYNSHSSFTRAFRQFHGISPMQARDKDAVFNIYPQITFNEQNFSSERGINKMAILGKIEFIELPSVRMIGKMVKNGGGQNLVPGLWEECFKKGTLDVLNSEKAVVDYYIGWMGEYDKETGQFTYIAGMLMPVGTEVPEGFDYRDLPACTVGNGYINGDFASGDVFTKSHGLTVEGIIQNGYEPNYSYGWSAEVYAKDLSFSAEEGTINYFCPCKKINI